MKSDKRISEIDIIKALAIIGMVLGHAGAPFTHFIYLFHMAVFFIASGFVYKNVSTGKIKDIWRFVLKKIKQLYLHIGFMHLDMDFVDFAAYIKIGSGNNICHCWCCPL